MSANPNSTREAFEQWATGPNGLWTGKASAMQVCPWHTVAYADLAVNHAWMGWQASRSHALEEAAKRLDEKALDWVSQDVVKDCAAVVRAMKDQA